MDKYEFIDHVLKKNGYQYQALKAVEELADLQQLLVRYGISEYSSDFSELREHVGEELADAELCLLQCRRIFKITDLELEQRQQDKIDRYLRREQNGSVAEDKRVRGNVLTKKINL